MSPVLLVFPVLPKPQSIKSVMGLSRNISAVILLADYAAFSVIICVGTYSNHNAQIKKKKST